MRPADTNPGGMTLDDFVRAYQAAWACVERADLKAFLPEPGHPLHDLVLREVVRVDIEFRWDRGQPRPLEEYRSSFPELFSDQESLQAITFEEYRLRRRSGENVTPAEYESRFGVDVTAWPEACPAAVSGDPAATARSPERPDEAYPRPGSGAERADAARPDQTRIRGHEQSNDAAARPFTADREGSSHHTKVFDALQFSDVTITRQPMQEPMAMPGVGSEFLGFRLLAELGAGTFGRVYLARQLTLADRLVVLKIAPHLFDESRTLAQLQHTHIMPIYSFHQTDGFQAVCMPFLGTSTLADILTDLRERQELPDSGKYLLDRIDARARHRFAQGGNPRPELSVSRPTGVRPPLESLSFVDAILWIAVRVADGLAHAHERGIVHRDVKPANILLTDDGQPMLLDFNLSEDTKLDPSVASRQVGGTLRYMAPEQSAGLQAQTCVGDARSDLYSFGIILHELLTGRHPFPKRVHKLAAMRRYAGEERRRPPKVRRRNPAVSPATESIIHHCLELDPSRRYQSARELHEDLRRQSEDLPLKNAPDPSLGERTRKWMRRHPRLCSSTGVAAIAGLLMLAVASAFLLRISQLAHLRVEQKAEQTRLEAVAARQRLHDDLNTIEFLLGSDIPGAEHEQREEGIGLAQEAIGRYRVLEALHWQEGPLVSALVPELRGQVYEDMSELLMLLAGAVAEQTRLDLALKLNELAAGCYAADPVPRAIWRQRAELMRSSGQSDEARRLMLKADATPVQTPRDRYLLLLTEFRQRGLLPEGLLWLKEASRNQNDRFSVWLILGNWYAALGRRNDAVECYDMAGALWPEAHWPAICRGLAYLEVGNDRRALAAFDEVIRLRPETMQAYYNRALAKYHLGDLAGAQADLTHLLRDPRSPLRAYFLRAKVRAKLGDREGARRDQEQGLRGEPLDERDWTSRGLVRQPRDPRAALADFETALKLNPRYTTALQDKANVLAEDLGRTEEAIKALDTLLALYPDHVPAIAGRGVLLARLGRREAAQSDARAALPRDPRPFNVYQVAGIYALTSRQNPDDRREALRLLESALNQGFGLNLLDRDRDLDAIRDQPEFRRLVEAARARSASAAPRVTTQRKAVEQRGRTGSRGEGANAPSG